MPKDGYAGSGLRRHTDAPARAPARKRAGSSFAPLDREHPRSVDAGPAPSTWPGVAIRRAEEPAASARRAPVKRRDDGPDQGALTWLQEFEAACRARDFDTGCLMFAQDAVAFGTWATAVHGLDNIEREQWRNVRPRIRGFTFEAEPEVRTDGDTAWIAAGWRSA